MPKPENIIPHKFKKGNPGGPGRPQGSKSIVKTIATILEKKIMHKDPLEGNEEKELTLREIMVLKLMGRALKGNLKAITEIIDRIDGKPQQTVKSANFNVDLHTISKMSDQELDELERDILNNINGEA